MGVYILLNQIVKLSDRYLIVCYYMNSCDWALVYMILFFYNSYSLLLYEKNIYKSKNLIIKNAMFYKSGGISG